jgi:CMP-N-acetylneuraminic acid synthetase
VPLKNYRDFAGKNLVNWTLIRAFQSEYLDEIILSTDFEPSLVELENSSKVTLLKRGSNTSRDESTLMDVILEVTNIIKKTDIVIILQPTSPLRTSLDIDAVIEKVVLSKAPVVSVFENTINPFWSFKIDSQNRLQSIFPSALRLRSQEIEKSYSLNGAIYADYLSNLLKHRTFFREETLPYIMEQYRSIDIDTWDDFIEAERRMLNG